MKHYFKEDHEIYLLTPYKKKIIVELKCDDEYILDRRYKIFEKDKYNTEDRYIYDKNGILCYNIVYKVKNICNNHENKLNNYLKNNVDNEPKQYHPMNKNVKRHLIIRIPFLFKNFIEKNGYINENDYNEDYIIMAQYSFRYISYIIENYKNNYKTHIKKYKNVLDELLLEVNKYILRPDNIKYYVEKYGIENFEDYI